MASIKRSCPRYNCTEKPCKRHGWMVRWTGPDGKAGMKTFDTRSEANAFAIEIEASKKDSRYIAPERAKMTIGEFAALYLDGKTTRTQTRKWRSGTRSNRVSHVNRYVVPLIGERRIGSITQPDIQALIDTYAETHAPGTVDAFYTTVRSLFSHAVRDGRMTATPCVDITLPEPEAKPIELFTPAEALAIAGQVPGEYRITVLLMAELGLRVSEALGVSVSRLVMNRQGVPTRLTIDRQITAESVYGPPKTRRSVRTLPVPPPLATALQKHLETYGASGPQGALVHGVRGGLMSYNTFGLSVWKPALCALALTGTPHGLRHSWCTRLLTEGVPPHAVATWAGHTLLELQRTYAHVLATSDDQLIEIIGRTFTDNDGEGGTPRAA